MKELVDTRDLLNRLTKQFEQAAVYRGSDQTNLDDFQNHWKPMLDAASSPDSHWDWIGKADYARQAFQRDIFCLECGGRTQGLMLVDLSQFSRLPAQHGQELVYIELLATAPWNRSKLAPSPLYKGVGNILMTTAISLSVEEGWSGRMGLHSTRPSESYYIDLGLTDLGIDTSKMRYFELSEAAARLLIEQGKGQDDETTLFEQLAPSEDSNGPR